MNRLLLVAWLWPTVAEAPLAFERGEPYEAPVEAVKPTWVLHRTARAHLEHRPALIVDVGWSGGHWGPHLSADDIRRVIVNHRHSIRFCYETALINDPSLEARVTVRFVIGESGAVTEAAVTESSGNGELDDCVAGRITLMPFPSPGPQAMAVVNYPFVFQR